MTNTTTTKPTEIELEEALLNLAQKSYIALMNTDIEQASDWYKLIQDSLEILGPARASKEVKLIMGEYLNRTQRFNSEMTRKFREQHKQYKQD